MGSSSDLGVAPGLRAGTDAAAMAVDLTRGPNLLERFGPGGNHLKVPLQVGVL